VTDDLDGHVQKDTLSKYDITGKQVIAYVFSLRPTFILAIKYRLHAVTPCGSPTAVSRRSSISAPTSAAWPRDDAGDDGWAVSPEVERPRRLLTLE
jgi:hypothetical protein